MKSLVEAISGTLCIATWLFGIVLANGGWLTALAVFFSPYAWYLLIERGAPS